MKIKNLTILLLCSAVYNACSSAEGQMKVADGQEIILHEETHYPFEESMPERPCRAST